MANVLRSGEPVRDQVVVIERPDGLRVVALVNIDAFKSEAGEIVGAINCFRIADAHLDKSDGKVVDLPFERQVRERAKARTTKPVLVRGGDTPEHASYYHELLQTLPAALYTTNAAGQITFYNEAAASLWGCRPELGKSEFCGSWKLYWPDGTPLPHDKCPMASAEGATAH